MQNTSKLQAGIYIGVVIIVLFVAAIFLGIIPGLRTVSFRATIVIWGTEPKNAFDAAFKAWGAENRTITLLYAQKNTSDLHADLLEAIATGNTPDLIMMPDSLLHSMARKLAPVPALFMTQREFFETFTSVAANAFFQNNLIYGFPFAVDPMVLYWNRDFFASEAIALPPTTWDEFLMDTQKLTKRTPDGTITRAGAAMGLVGNIPQAVDIVSLLILQGGASIIDPQTHRITLGDTFLQNQIRVSPTETALRFYTDFARREKTSYAWNHTFPPPQEAFAREDLAMFLGNASLLGPLMRSNPHSAIGVSPVPQYQQATLKIGYARTWAFVVPLQSRKRDTAWRVASFLASSQGARAIANGMWLAPARRDLLGQGHEYPPFSVFYEETLRARSWYDPDPAQSTTILKNMIESVAAGRDAKAAATEARLRLESLF